ncbi:MAG TPA: hypothetical protein VJV05_02055 [Pyrinomonadaceae bacterium]|nr:hypothetical protein [Pyrinomonadaceae bacterium]
MGRNKGVWLLAIYLFLAFYLLPMFPHGGSDNEISRWATAASLVEKGSFEISWLDPLVGANVDTAIVGSYRYSNKPPGMALMAVPFYGIARLIVGPPDASNIRVTWFVMRFVLSSFPLFLLGLWLYAKEGSEFSLATLLFATPLFVYSLLFFSHVLVGIIIYFAFRLLYDQRVMTPMSALVAGMLGGICVMTEFIALIPVAVMGAGILFTEKRDRLSCFATFVLGGLPFAVFLMFYNSSLFGSAFSMSYSHESFPEWAEVAGQGVLGIGLPSLSNIYLLLFSPARGLFFAAPVLILAVICFFTSLNRSTLRHRVKIAMILVTIVIVSGHGAAHGGWGFTARYLVLLVPLMLDAVFDHETYEFSNLWKGIIFAVSFVFCTLPILTFPLAPPEFAVPQNDFWLSLLINERWASPTLASAFGVSATLWTLVPVAFALVLAVVIVMTSMRRRDRFAIGMALGCGVCAGVMFWPGVDSPEDKFRRATIAERYFKPADRLEPYRQDAVANNNWQMLNRVNEAEWNIANIRAYAPNDFPYLPATDLEPSPVATIRQAIELQKRGDIPGAEKVLVETRTRFPFAQCSASGNLAVVYYASGRKDIALSELEAMQPLINPASRADCLRGQFLLGTLYREMSRPADADRAFQAFLQNSQFSNDREILSFRQQLTKK